MVRPAACREDISAMFKNRRSLSRRASLIPATLRPYAVLVLLVPPPALAQTKCELPPAGMTCPGDQIVWMNIPSKIYHLKGQRYFGCTKNGKFMCQHDADREGDRPDLNGQ
jgi:hypothetical protein